MTANYFKRLAQGFAVYMVSRKPGLPAGYSMQDMSNDYATMIKDELGGPVDVMGISTGGPMAQYFAVDHPKLIRRLVLAMTGYRLTEQGAKLQRPGAPAQMESGVLYHDDRRVSQGNQAVLI